MNTSNKKLIVIFSPQDWGHIQISKHHYALELAKDNTVLFITAPEKNLGLAYNFINVAGTSIQLLRYEIPIPYLLKFKWPYLYKQASERRLKNLLSETFQDIELCIDFGCYNFLGNLNFVKAKNKIFFPVDDHQNLKICLRGADKFYTVSTNVFEKFKAKGYSGIFVNHGLGASFAARAIRNLEMANKHTNAQKKIRIAYSGNLFIPFLDIPVISKVIRENPEVEFHFFGSSEYNSANCLHVQWFDFLQNSQNLKLRGFLNNDDLAEELNEMDGCILCYRPDYVNYHGENSHKVLEYLSTGKVLVSTYLSLYAESDLLIMSPKDRNDLFPDLFKTVINNLDRCNSEEMREKRMKFALDNTYKKQIERIFSSL